MKNNPSLRKFQRLGKIGLKSEEYVEGSDSIFPLTHSPTQKDSIVAYAYEAVSYKKKKKQRAKQKKNKNKLKTKKKENF